MKKQKTLKQEVVFSGIGVHSGALAKITLKPAVCDYGIVLKNAHNPQHEIKIGSIVPEAAMHATVIKNDEWGVSTIEHLLAALRMLGVDNVAVHIEGPEIPILDGSSLPFIQEMHECGIVEQEAQKRFMTPKEQLTFEDEKGRLIEINPGSLDDDSDDLIKLDYQASFQHPLVGDGQVKNVITQKYFLERVAPARTFGFVEQLPFLRKHGLAQGSSLGNTVVIGSDELINEPRFSDEFTRHKVLDLIGDLGLLEYQLVGSVKARNTGHSFNRLVVDHSLKYPELWKII